MPESTTKEIQSLYLERISTHLLAMRNVKPLLESSSDSVKREAFDSVHRIAHSLKSYCRVYGFPHIAKIAQQVELANRGDMEKQLNTLLGELEQIVVSPANHNTLILIVEDDKDISQILKNLLSNPNREIIIAGNASTALKIISSRRISLVVLDLMLPDADGRNLLVTMRELPSAYKIPVLVLSGRTETNTKTECYALGATAYFEKPFNADTLAAVVSNTLQFRADQAFQDVKQPLEEIRDTRREPDSWADRLKKKLSIGIIKIDYFKSMQDNYGEELTNRILKRVYNIIRKSFRKTDHLDQSVDAEFIAVFTDTAVEDAVIALNKALENVRAELFQTVEGEIFQVTFSAGVAELKKGMTIKNAAAEANTYLQYVISSGGNRILCSKIMTEKSRGRIIIAEDDDLIASVVKHRLEQDGFDVLHFRDGESAFSAAKDGSISLFIMDTRLPIMDGFELLKNIRSIKNFARVPIVLLGASGKEEDVVRGFKLGADDFIQKPFSPGELKARINRLLMKSK
ncbi:response regulator [bacterium]|nr:response regulator [bacterium]